MQKKWLNLFGLQYVACDQTTKKHCSLAISLSYCTCLVKNCQENLAAKCIFSLPWTRMVAAQSTGEGIKKIFMNTSCHLMIMYELCSFGNCLKTILFLSQNLIWKNKVINITQEDQCRICYIIISYPSLIPQCTCVELLLNCQI